MSVTTTASEPRYWSPREGQIRLDSCGFLLAPEGPLRAAQNPDLTRLADQANRDCLVLLGEPGMGKSTELDFERKRRDHLDFSANTLIWLDLGEYGDETRLIRELFETKEWESWRAGEGSLHLYLDALDECRLHLSNVAVLVLGQLRKLPHHDRLKLRIVCRTGAWPHHLEDGLKKIWPGDRTGVFELAPLRRRDMAVIVGAMGLEDVEGFVSEVEKRHAGPLAAKPITLKLLANLYKDGGQLPHTRAELYRRGCRALCEESNESRRAAGQFGILGVERRMAVAARIAAATVICGRSAIWDGPDLGDRPQENITVSELSGRTEHDQGGDFAVTEACVREVLSDTGLFSSRGPRRMGWAHRTFAEYLAADYLASHGLGVEQIKGLLLHPHMPGKVVPQLQEATAWLAGMVPGVFRAILASNPAVLVPAEIDDARIEDRGALVTALLRAATEDRLGDMGFEARSEYRKLEHPGLAAQLEPFLSDKGAAIGARRLAIEIAHVCELRDVQFQLADLVLDREESEVIRTEAAYAVCRLADEPTRRRMRGLLDTDLEEDTHDRLMGCALNALWPGLISAEELFSKLTRPKKVSFTGSYQSFLIQDLVPGLSPGDLPTALRWVAAQGDPRVSSYFIQRTLDIIVIRAWEEMADTEISELVASIVWSRFEVHSNESWPLFEQANQGQFWSETDRRRKLVLAILPRLAEENETPGRIYYAMTRLLNSEDLPWLIGLFDIVEDETPRATLARLARETFLRSGFRSHELILAAIDLHPILSAECRRFFAPVSLDSAEAASDRENYEAIRSIQRRSQVARTLDPPPTERVKRLLVRDEAGDQDAWWQLTLEMTLEPSSTSYTDTYRSDLTAVPGWRDADLDTRARIRDAAHRYVLSRRPAPEAWFFEEGTCYHPDEAAFKALRLLAEHAVEWFEALGPDEWSNWAPVVVGHPALGGPAEDEVQRRLVGQAYRHAPEELLLWLGRWLAEQGRREHPLVSARLWADLPGPALTGILMQRVEDSSTNVRVVEILFNDLLARGVSEGLEFAASLLDSAHLEDAGQRVRSLVAAKSLLTYAPDAGWAALWPVLRSAPDFGRILIGSVAPSLDRAGSASFLDRLAESQVAEFYAWLVQQFPHHEDKERDGVHNVETREYVERFRNDVLRHLEWRGTSASLEALDWIARELPDLPWLPRVRLQAEKVVMERTWVPHRPDDLWALAGDEKARLVASGDQLLDVVMESIGGYQSKLRGVTPASFMLWDKRATSRFRPKEEERLSDALKLHLTDDLKGRGVIANREVVIRSGMGGKAGERTDIHVVASTRQPRQVAYDRVTVVVEVKGCWNRDILTAMRDQLLDRYLGTEDCRHGVYVVGWFPVEQWDTDDYRRDESRRQLPPTLAEARSLFTKQADDLSVGGRRIGALILDCGLS